MAVTYLKKSTLRYCSSDELQMSQDKKKYTQQNVNTINTLIVVF